jgi:hypothetical protein
MADHEPLGTADTLALGITALLGMGAEEWDQSLHFAGDLIEQLVGGIAPGSRVDQSPQRG